MAEEKSNKELYAMLLAMKDELRLLTIHVRALRKELKGEQDIVQKN